MPRFDRLREAVYDVLGIEIRFEFFVVPVEVEREGDFHWTALGKSSVVPQSEGEEIP